jgi:uncharacterized protein
MKIAAFRFDENLRLLLPRDKRSGQFAYSFNGPQSVKHLIESLGIPHTEVGELRANGDLVGPGYLVRDGDRVEVRVAAAEDSGSEPRFVLDGHLGRLAARLRMLGLDCLYRPDYADPELAGVSVAEGRILLTRDRRLLMHKSIEAGYLLRSLEPPEQFLEVVRRYGLKRWIKPFKRCLRCNHPLEPVSKEAVLDRLEPLTRLHFEEFQMCPACGQVYWKGSHYERMQKLITGLG